jgi:DNA-binding Lrp family transcriptional regulator
MAKLPELSSRILQVVKDHGRASISAIQAITGANRNTLKVRLRELVQGGYLTKQGKGKPVFVNCCLSVFCSER